MIRASQTGAVLFQKMEETSCRLKYECLTFLKNEDANEQTLTCGVCTDLRDCVCISRPCRYGPFTSYTLYWAGLVGGMQQW